MGKMKEHRIMPLLAVLCLVLSGIHKLDAQQPEDSADLVFLIDGSNNVGRAGFNSIRDFLANYVERRLEVGRSRMQVGVVQFSDDVKIEFTLDEHTSKRNLINAMKNLQFAGGEESNLGAAVEYVVEQMFSSAGGSRREEGVPQSLIVITGGPASDELRDAANALKLNSIITFGIGVARADSNELQQIATDDTFVFTTSQFQAIGQLETQIIPYIAGVAQRTIVLQPPTIITEVTEVNKRDIVFLIDSSSDLGGPSYAAIREFIVKLVNRLEIGLDLIRVGLAQYGRDVKPEFYLNTFGAKKDVIAHLKKMRIVNSTPLNTGAALSNVQRNFFTASAGSRANEGIPQLLVVITGGRSRDDISQASDSLKRAGILTFSIGSKSAEDSELQEIAFDSSLIFKPTEFKQVPLQSLLPQVLGPLRTLTGVVISEGPTEVLNQRDIVFLLDGSVNVGSSNFPLVRDFLVNVINNLGISSEGTRIGLAQFSDTPRTEFYLNTLTSKSDLTQRLGQLRIKGGNLLNIGSAIQFVLRNHFTRSAGSRIQDNIPQLLVVLAAGKSSDNIQSAAVDLMRSGVLTFCIGVGNADKEELDTIAFNPSLVYEMDDFEALRGFSQQLITPITTYVRGEVTEVTVTTDEDVKKDVVFLIDGSDAAIAGFSSLRSFIQRVVEYLNVGKDKVRIAVVQYSNTVRPMFLLNTHSDQQDVIRAIQSMSPIGGSPLNTGAALNYATSNVFTQSAGSRSEERVPQFLILLTTGKSRDDVQRPAMSLKRAGVVPYAIGAGSADRTELQSIAFTPDFVLYFPDVYQLENAYQTFSQRVSTITTSEISTIAKTIATDDISRRKDIVFLIDGSNDGRSSFPSIRSFIQRVVENLDVGQDRIRIGVVQYSDTTRPSFLLNTHPDGQGVVRAIQQLSPIGGSPLNTGAALDYVTSNVFTSSAGSRSAEGVPQFLVLLTTARSRDDVRRPATDLKNSGVIPFAIGVRNADAGELRTISYIPDYAVTVPDVSQLGSVYQTLTRVSELQAGEIERLRQSRPTVTVQAGAKRDVVFLVDGSRGAVSEFSNVKSLIERVVATMDVSPDTTRVAVVQYSEDPKVEFLLNAHSTKEEVQSAVKRIRPKGGSSVNTGNALEYVSKNIFTRPSGSRIEEQVPQFLIVTSSGPSSDDVGEGARTVKDSSVFPFVIGKNIDNDEARKITFGQDFVYSVSSFQELPSMEQRLLSSVSRLDQSQITEIILRQTGTTEESDPDRRDIVFLVDGSTKTGTDGTANIRDFILKVVQSLEIAPNKARVGLVQFSDTPNTEFLLKTYMNKPALVQKIQRLRHKGGQPLNVGKALDFVAKSHFIKSAGSRIEEGVPQFLVLLTGGKSEDDVSGAARLLGTNRIRSLAVASGSADRDEVRSIVSDPRYLFTVREFKDLSNIENVLFRSFTSPVEPTLTPSQPEPTSNGKKEADIVFLVDGSMNLGRDNFKEVLVFVSGIVDALVEEEGAIQIGLAQFNSDVTDEFFLREYKTSEDIMDAITKAEYKGGRVASLGTAIRHLQDKHFVKPAGSRIDSNVPQIAFIVTGAKSVSEGQAAALALSGRGVKVFAIGVGSIDMDEVSKISSDAPSAFRVPDVQQLSELNEQVLITLETALQKRSVCPGVVEGVRDCNLEVIIGFDSEVSSGQNLFNTYRGLESKLRHILERISNMQKISCSGDKKPNVKVAILAQGRTGPVEAFDFSEYRQELVEKVLAMGTRGPFVLSSQTLQTYLNKFKTSGEDGSLKIVIHITDGADVSMSELQKASLALQTAGVRALLFVGMENALKFDQIMKLEFGRGFTYINPLRLNRVDLDYEIIEELDNIAEKGCCGVPCKCAGERGDIGFIGVAAPKGAPGLKGHQGFPGEEGGPGERGPPGTNGTQGFRGCPGQRGFKGSRGFSGDKGEVGEIGLDGIDGEDGKRGTPGSAGDSGSQGSRGVKGQKGQRGERGDQGLRGDPGEPGTDSTQRGSRGPKGESGSLGESGRDGPAGQAGGPGKAGGPGRRGPPGVKGNRGGPGGAGGVGEQGLRGPQGPAGQIGTPGTRGEQGLPGPRGAGGTPGTAGDRGRPGPLGRKGEPGDIGAKGSDGLVGPRGETGDDGRDGVGKPGPKGRKGETGFPGYPGVKGAPGDKGANGDLGPNGSRGRRGNAGNPGTLGSPGDPGYPGPSGLKGEQDSQIGHCGLVKQIKNSCPCCYGPKECPVYPTDLVFAIDSSTDVNRNQFNNMKDAVLRMVNKLTITDSNCPRGARVALLTYNSEVTTEVRFSEALRKPAMLEVIKDLQLKTSTKQRRLDTVMSFVARNTFKRARGGFLTRKVAVFFSNAATRASVTLNEAVLKLYDAGVASVFLTNQQDTVLGNALKVNNTEVGKTFVLRAGAQLNDTISKILSCHVCLDVCDPASECGDSVPRGDLRLRRSAATDVDIDLAFLLDSSDSTNPAQFAEIKKFVSHIIGQLELSTEPKSSSHHARIAVLQHAPYEHQANATYSPVKVDVGLTDYTDKEKLQAFIKTKMTQLYGARALSNAIKYVVEHVFEGAPNPRTMKVIFLFLTGEVKLHELQELRQTVIEAKCKGYFFVILSIGSKVNSGHLHSLASEPHEVFSKQADTASELHEESLMRFGLHLPGFLSSENAFHLSPEIRKHCDWFQNDPPAASTSQDVTDNDGTQNTVIPDELLASRKPEVITVGGSTETPTDRAATAQITSLPMPEVLASDVTESSVYLSWASVDLQKPDVYELSITALDDNTLVLKQNVTGSERLIGGLIGGKEYQVTVTGQHKSLGLITYQTTFTTSKSETQTDVVANSEMVVSTEPLDTPEIAVEKTIQLPTLESKAIAVGPEVCKLPKEEGTCREFALKWYYDSETNSCARFWYGGCGGNENRFSTQKECEKICISAPLNPSVVSAIGT